MVRKRKTKSTSLRSIVAPFIALVALLGLAAYAILGPTGIIAAVDYNVAYKQRSQELAALEKERDALLNRKRLLNQDNVDPDLAGEMMRKELNVVAPDEVVVPME